MRRTLEIVLRYAPRAHGGSGGKRERYWPTSASYPSASKSCLATHSLSWYPGTFIQSTPYTYSLRAYKA